MQTKMTLGFKRGTKVVPKSKSVWGSLSSSREWGEAQANKQPYLYVIDEDTIDDGVRCLVLSNVNAEETGGDFFLPSDVEIYKEEKPMQYDVWYATNEGNCSARKIRPEVAQYLIDALDGKCNFLLLPSGQLILRVYVNDYARYEFYTLPKENFFVRVREDTKTYTKEECMPTTSAEKADLRQWIYEKGWQSIEAEKLIEAYEDFRAWQKCKIEDRVGNRNGLREGD